MVRPNRPVIVRCPVFGPYLASRHTHYGFSFDNDLRAWHENVDRMSRCLQPSTQRVHHMAKRLDELFMVAGLQAMCCPNHNGIRFAALRFEHARVRFRSPPRALECEVVLQNGNRVGHLTKLWPTLDEGSGHLGQITLSTPQLPRVELDRNLGTLISTDVIFTHSSSQRRSWAASSTLSGNG
jgi:hypothetical protein